MIIVDIRVAALEKSYNFSVDERARVEDLIEELVEMIKQKEGVQFRGDVTSLVLCSADKETCFKKTGCLGKYGVSSGDELILV